MTSPRGIRRILMWRSPGQISTRPAATKSPDCASLTSRLQESFRRRAKVSVNPTGMCCTTRMAAAKSAGSWLSMNSSELGPPVEMPMATTLEAGDKDRRNALGFGLGGDAGGRQGAAAEGTGDGGLDLLDQLVGDFLHAFGQNILRLGDKVEGSHMQCLEGCGGAFAGVGADHDDRNLMGAHDLAQGLDAVHARHFQIQGDGVGSVLLDFLEGEGSVHGGADDVDLRVALQ